MWRRATARKTCQVLALASHWAAGVHIQFGGQREQIVRYDMIIQ